MWNSLQPSSRFYDQGTATLSSISVALQLRIHFVATI
ncbi:hypothetical protein RBSWK_02300 [Rhodopirellula baltica SWK14]|uniref:Uncharacterized protein n=1 Tax=Rhodopirellula baltica SWK14 TaxID=993516 RepID=L7CHL0_RHOBT|nr:hypothetical protein RBSWK_02300 [Rhodopirellula baltica SWK14]